MKRETLVTALIIVLAIVALGVAAATLDTAVTTESDGFGGTGSGGAIGPTDDADSSGLGETPGAEPLLSPPPICYEFLREPPALLLLVGFLATIAGLAYRDTDSVLAAAVVVGAVTMPVGLLWFLLSTCRDTTFDVRIGIGVDDYDELLPSGGGSLGTGGDGSAVSTPEALFLVVVGVAIVVSVLVLLAASGDDDGGKGSHSEGSEEPSASEPDLTAVGRTAGDVADRIEAVDADNEVYRAWREMTDVLDVERPASATPAEFAETAIAAGVEPEPVEQLTAVFEQVRYGGTDPTDSREREAVEALRRIETAHGGDE